MKSVQKTKYNFATDLVINRRTERLIHQFEYNLNHKVDLTNLKHPRNSFDRLFLFIYEYTDISYIESIKKDMLLEYLRYHHLEKFNCISFTQAVKDIKSFLYVRNNNISTSTLDIDFSIQNYYSWTRI